MDFFYARCTDDESANEQIAHAKELGFEDAHIYIDKSGGKNAHRAALLDMLSKLRENDGVFVTELSRFGKNTRDLLDLMERLGQARVNLRSEKDDIDTTLPDGELVFRIFNSVAEFQKQIKLESAAVGRITAKAQGKQAGRPKVDQDALDLALHMFQFDLEKSIPEICRKTHISRSTLYRAADERGVRRASHLLDRCAMEFEQDGKVSIISHRDDTQENQS